MAIYALQNSIYKPAMRAILSITNAVNALVTTTVDGVIAANHNYITGTIVRLDIPPGFGMTQANQLYAPITVVSPIAYTIEIDTTHFDAFAIPIYYPYSYQQAQSVPIGEINSLLTAAVQNVLR